MNWIFKKNTRIYTEEFWYDLTVGGFIKPEKVLSNETQINELKSAIDLVRSFEKAIENLGE